jgi:aminoglycoside/choline kinase family phosphotransferase/choline kinase
MILAAGYGTRLSPVTDHLPKPLLPLGGRPLLGHVIDTLDRVAVGAIGVNTHHLPTAIHDYLRARADRDRFRIFHETEILGTGGALDGARGFLAAADDFLLHNGDVICDADLSRLVAEHRRTGALATLLLVDWPAVNSVTLGPDGRILRIGTTRELPAATTGTRSLTYAGIGMFSAELLQDIGPGFSTLIDPLVRAIVSGTGRVRGHAPAGVFWNDLGTLGRYLAVQAAMEEKPSPNGPALDVAEPPGPGRLERLTGHGSDRRFWRLAAGDWSAVAMAGGAGDQEFDRMVAIGRFLERHDLGVPRLLAVEPEERTLLMEDLGPDSLYRLVQAHGAGEATVREGYRRAVDRLLQLQDVTTAAQRDCPEAVDHCLDTAGLRWETDYFRERFLTGHLGLDDVAGAELTAEFDRLAAAAARQPLVLIHRDYQSQNIHLRDGSPWLVDFQGMRLGPVTYDLASLIYDPYVDLQPAFRTALVDRFAAGRPETPRQVRAMTLTASLQRLMQALGAYGYLGNVLGKTEFLAHIPGGIAHLKAVMAAAEAMLADGNQDEIRWLPGALPHLAALLARTGDSHA